MKNISLIILSLLFLQVNFCAAQTSPDSLPQKVKQKAQLGIFFSPDYCNQDYKPVRYENWGSGVAARELAAARLDSITNSGFGYSIGVNFISASKSKFALMTGIYFSLKVKRYNGFIYTNGVDGRSGVFYLPDYEKEKVAYLELPLALNYAFTKNSLQKFRLSGFAGGLLAVNCGTSEIGTSRFWRAPGPFPASADGFLVGKREAFKTAYVGIITGIKADYKFADHFAFNISPTFKYLPITWSLPRGRQSSLLTREVLYSVGCAFGITYYLN